MVAACSDGRVIFYSKPNIQLSKQAQSDDFIQTSIKKTHEGELYAICSSADWIAIGGLDNKISFWKATSGALSATLLLPSDEDDEERQKDINRKLQNFIKNETTKKGLIEKRTKAPHSMVNLTHISDMHFLEHCFILVL